MNKKEQRLHYLNGLIDAMIVLGATDRKEYRVAIKQHKKLVTQLTA